VTGNNIERNEELEKYTSAIREQLPELRRRFKVKSLGVFGSYVKGKQTESSDLDLLVEFEKSPGLLGFIAMENYLSDLLGVKVDLVMKESLKPTIGKRILAEVVPV
jgi:predicted nucleotidyltransferase